MAATLKDIAKRTGLSVPSVCLILNGRGDKFRETTRQSVLKAARELKYRPDMVMRRMGRASARRDAVGFLVRTASASPIGDQVIHEYLCGTNDVLLEHDQLMVLAKLSHLADGPDQRPPRLIAERFIDGLLLVETALPESLERLIEHYEIVTVWINPQRAGETDCAYPDNIHAGRLATEHLLSLGHTNVAFVRSHHVRKDGSIVQPFSAQHREQGYREAITTAGLETNTLDCRCPDDTDQHPGADDADTASKTDLDAACQHIVDSMNTDTPITGVVVASFGNAIRLLECLNMTDLRCPEDVSIIAAGDLHLFREGWAQISRVSCDRYTIGRWGAEMLLEKISNAGSPQPSRVYRGKIIAGETTAPAKAG